AARVTGVHDAHWRDRHGRAAARVVSHARVSRELAGEELVEHILDRRPPEPLLVPVLDERAGELIGGDEAAVFEDRVGEDMLDDRVIGADAFEVADLPEALS